MVEIKLSGSMSFNQNDDADKVISLFKEFLDKNNADFAGNIMVRITGDYTEFTEVKDD